MVAFKEVHLLCIQRRSRVVCLVDIRICVHCFAKCIVLLAHKMAFQYFCAKEVFVECYSHSLHVLVL